MTNLQQPVVYTHVSVSIAVKKETKTKIFGKKIEAAYPQRHGNCSGSLSGQRRYGVST